MKLEKAEEEDRTSRFSQGKKKTSLILKVQKRYFDEIQVYLKML